ncbi:phytochelatin synthase family protein [Altererythrobacter sp. MF3-039]|uniref:phytochelatin synthase family protein n=1 Tax=Altererythrobacter sp. MF3-039 TaxID=3252901 RepID=UPI00390C8CAE
MRVVKWLGVTILVLAALFLGFAAYQLTPKDEPRPLPPSLVSAETSEGQALLAGAEALDDHEELSANFEQQRLISFCGPASSVAVLNSLGRNVTQTSLFTDRASEVRPLWRAAAMGMTIDMLAAILEAHDLEVSMSRANLSGVDDLRAAIKRNLATDDDYLLVNYQREVLGQDRVGHISPLAAYDADTDRVLIMDTASYKYPHTWVPVTELHAAMATIDGETGKSRGWIEVRER